MGTPALPPTTGEGRGDGDSTRGLAGEYRVAGVRASPPPRLSRVFVMSDRKLPSSPAEKAPAETPPAAAREPGDPGGGVKSAGFFNAATMACTSSRKLAISFSS